MNRNKVLLLVLLLASLSLAACSGPKTGTVCTVNCGGPSTHEFVLMISDTPPLNSSILSFKVTISGVSLHHAAGDVSLPISPSQLVVELTRLQSDSFFAGSFPIPTDTYDSMTVAVSNPDITFFNQTGATLQGCLNNTVCEIQPVAASAVKVTASPFPLVVGGNFATGVSLEFDLNKALTSALGVDFTQAGAVNAFTVPRTGTDSAFGLELSEDFMGIVTALAPDPVPSVTDVTVQSGTRGTLVGFANSGAVFDSFGNVCPAVNATCLHTNQTLSIDAAAGFQGGNTSNDILELDLLDNVSVDEAEGTIYSIDSPTQFKMVLSDKVVASGDATLTAALAGNPVQVTLANPTTFSVDLKGLPANAFPALVGSFSGGTDTGVLAPGQTVMVQVTSASTVSGTPSIQVTTNSVRLRFSRLTATVTGPPANPLFNITGLPPFFGVAGTLQAESLGVVANFDNFINFSDLTDGTVVSIRALYFKNSNPSFLAFKIRKH